MRFNTVLLCVFAVSAFLLTGCSESDPIVAPPATAPTAETSAPDVAEAPNPVTMPFRGEYSTTFTLPSTPPPFLEFHIWGEGTATLVGASTWEGPSVVDLTQVPPVQTSTALFTAADGSQFTMVAIGVGLPGPDEVYDVAFEGTFTLADGTGRFAGLSGSGVYQGIASNSLAIGEIAYDGTITLPRPPVIATAH